MLSNTANSRGETVFFGILAPTRSRLSNVSENRQTDASAGSSYKPVSAELGRIAPLTTNEIKAPETFDPKAGLPPLRLHCFRSGGCGRPPLANHRHSTDTLPEH